MMALKTVLMLALCAVLVACQQPPAQAHIQSKATGSYIVIMGGSTTLISAAPNVNYAILGQGVFDFTTNSLKCDATGLFISAENAGSSALVANRPSAGAWEAFTFTKRDGGYWTILSSVNGQLVAVQPDYSLLANVPNSGSPPDTALFSFVTPNYPLQAGSRGLRYSVYDFNAKGDNVTDDTPAFQNALNFVASLKGGIVEAPAGQYVFRSTLSIPEGVTLQGTFSAPPSHPGSGIPNFGTVFLPYSGKGDSDGTPFITINGDATLAGVVIFYPEQVSAGIPIPFPWTVTLLGNNPAFIDSEIVNPYQGIYSVGNQRHYIARIHGQPLYIGLYLDAIYDIGRVEDIHWNPWFSTESTLYGWQLANARAFVMARSDWEYVFNTFAFGYNIGYHFIQTSAGACNGNFLGIGADNCYTAVKVDAASNFGLLITNGEFTSFEGPDPTEFVTSEQYNGKVEFLNSAFWGGGHQIAKIYGSGTVSFSGCTFVQWNGDNTGRYAIQAYDTSSVILEGNEFQQDAPQVYLAPTVRRAIIANNLITGSVRISQGGSGNIQISGNSNA